MEATAQVKAEVTTVLNKLKEAYARKDVDSVMALFVPDMDLAVFGIEEAGQVIGPSAYRAHLEKEFGLTDSNSIEFNRSSVSAASGVAWVGAEVTLKALLRRTSKQASIPAAGRWSWRIAGASG